MMDFTLADWIGILGSIIIAGAYLAVSRKWVDADKPAYHLINLMGAGFILVSLWYRPNPGAILIEVLWVTIALTSLYGWYRRQS